MRRVAFLARLAPWVAMLTTAAPLGAQHVRGIVQQPDSATLAPGVVVTAGDERGDVLSRALSGDDGTFDIQVPGPGTYVLRLLRVGYRPTVLPALTVPVDGVSGVRAVLGATPVVLAAVTVRSENVCGTTQDAGRVIAQLWEEARTALSAAVLSTGSRTLDAEWQAFQFAMDRRATQARELSVVDARGVTERPFISASAADLAERGYAVFEGKTWTFRAPDAAALLSDQFAATHCFHVQAPSPARAQWIGVEFSPTPARRSVHDITGTLWLDRATSELRMLEFRYTNLPPEADDPQVGGYVEYARMPSGQWLVARWALRMPRLVRRSVGGAAIPGGGRDDRTVIAAIDVTGGALIRVLRGRAVLFEADSTMLANERSPGTAPARPSACGPAARPGVAVNGTVRNGREVASGAVVRIMWDPGKGLPPMTLATVADARGAFRLPCVAPGVPLRVIVTVAGVSSATLEVAPVTGSNAIVDIDLHPAPDSAPLHIRQDTPGEGA